MTLIVILSTVLGLTLVVLSWVVVRLRRLPVQALAKALDELRVRQDTLEALTEKVSSARTADLNRQPHPGPPVRRHGVRSRRVDAAEPTAVAGPTLITVPSLATAPLPSSAAVSHDLGQRFSPIWELADTGATPDAIARSTGQPIGQVELILALRRQLKANAQTDADPDSGEFRLT